MYLVGAVVVILSAIYWFYFRDDGRFDEPESDIVIKPPWEYNFKNKEATKKTTQKGDGIPMKILFYSQTGTAEDFAHRLGEDVRSYGFEPSVLDVEEYESDYLESEKLIVFLASTYGEGDPPDNAVAFHSWLLNPDRETGLLNDVKFAVFGLGNKTYDQFNATGKQVNTRLEELGAHRLYVLGEGDDDANIENDFLVWKKGFGVAVCEAFGLAPPDTSTVADLVRRQKMITYKPDDPKVKSGDMNNTSRWKHLDEAKARIIDTKNPFMAKVMSTRELHTPLSERSCLHVEISTHDGLLNYQPGDHIGFYPANDPTLVHKLGALLGADLDQVISMHPADDFSGRNAIVGPCTLKAALLQYYEIASVARKPQLRAFAQYAQDEEQKKRLLKLSSDDPDDQQLYDKYIVADNRTIIEVLKEFPDVKVPLDHFLEQLPKMQPRFYSISSSPSVHPDTVHVTAVLVSYTTATKRDVLGVTTGWFNKNRPNTEQQIIPRVPAFIRRSNFKLPASLKTPIVMIGPGTGLAPFRGFSQERSFQRKKEDFKEAVDTMLFFGCRNPGHDYIYQAELEEFHKEGTISDLVVAFSRLEGASKVYVQHKMQEDPMAQKIWQVLEAGGNLYVCGDAKLMARDVSATLTEIVMKHSKKTKEEAEKYTSELQKSSR